MQTLGKLLEGLIQRVHRGGAAAHTIPLRLGGGGPRPRQPPGRWKPQPPPGVAHPGPGGSGTDTGLRWLSFPRPAVPQAALWVAPGGGAQACRPQLPCAQKQDSAARALHAPSPPPLVRHSLGEQALLVPGPALWLLSPWKPFSRHTKCGSQVRELQWISGCSSGPSPSEWGSRPHLPERQL